MKIRSTLVAAVAAALLVPAGSAAADTVVLRDRAGDLVNYGENGTVVSPGYEVGDITGTVIRHGATKVRVTIAHRDLAKVGLISTTVLVRSGKGKAAARRITVGAGTGDYRGRVTIADGRGRPVACKVRHRISYTEETVRLAIPRSCLRHPRWVTVAATVLSTPDNYVSVYGDSAGAGRSLDFPAPVFSPRVYR